MSFLRFDKNRRLLDGLEAGARIAVVDLQESPRKRRVMEFVARRGDALVALDSSGTVRKFALRFCSCGHVNRPVAGRKVNRGGRV